MIARGTRWHIACSRYGHGDLDPVVAWRLVVDRSTSRLDNVASQGDVGRFGVLVRMTTIANSSIPIADRRKRRRDTR
ncbi:MAG TPA: hypothetical protein VIU61_08470 [Kofleriaceae bacterium]